MKPLALTFNELLAIEALTAVSPDMRVHDERPTSREFVTGVGVALLQAQEDGQADLIVSQEDCWTIRDLLDIHTRIGKDAVGLAIKLKVYKLLDNWAFEDALGIPVGDKDVDYTRKDASESPNQGSPTGACEALEPRHILSRPEGDHPQAD